MRCHFFKLIICAFVYFAAITCSFAQNLIVNKAEYDPSDLSASTNPILDKKGHPCALLRISAPSIKGITFSEEAVHSSYEDGEYTVFVPAGTKHITVSHPNYEPLKIRMKDLGIKLESKNVYLFSILPEEAVRQISQVKEKKRQYVSIHVSPSHAVVVINGEKLQSSHGEITKLLPIGNYVYNASAKDFHDSEGTFVLEKKGSLVAFDVKLAPTFGWLSLESTNQSDSASVSLDGKEIGMLPIWRTDRIPSGNHELTIKKEFYKTYKSTIDINDGKVTKLKPELEINYSLVDLEVDNDAEIWINGQLKGNSSWTGRLLCGNYSIETRKTSHTTQTYNVEILPSLSKRVIVLPAPIPIYGGLTVLTNLEGADVYVDGTYMGETPICLEQVLIGKHELQICKEDCSTIDKTIDIEESKTTEINAELVEVSDVTNSKKGISKKKNYEHQMTLDDF